MADGDLGNMHGHPEAWRGDRFVVGKLLLASLIVVNAYFLVVPAATGYSLKSLGGGTLLPEFREAYLRESIFGAANVLLAIAAAALGIAKSENRQKTA